MINQFKMKLIINTFFIIAFIPSFPAYTSDVETLKKDCLAGKEDACLKCFLKNYEDTTDQTFLAEIAVKMKDSSNREIALNHLVILSETLTAETKALLSKPIKDKQSDWERNVRAALSKGIPVERWPNIEKEEGVNTDYLLDWHVPPGHYRFQISYSEELWGGYSRRSSTDEITLTATLALDTAYCIYSGATMNNQFWEPKISRVCKGSECASVVKKHIALIARKAAAYRLKDQSVVAELAKNTKEEEAIRIIAIWGLKDQGLIAELAKNEKSKDVRLAAIGSLNDQKILMEIATTGGSTTEDSNSQKKVSTQNEDIDVDKKAYQQNQDNSFRLKAIERLTDQSVLTELAKNDKNWEIQERAIGALTDKVVLAEIAEKDRNIALRSRAKMRLEELEKEK